MNATPTTIYRDTSNTPLQSFNTALSQQLLNNSTPSSAPSQHHTTRYNKWDLATFNGNARLFLNYAVLSPQSPQSHDLHLAHLPPFRFGDFNGLFDMSSAVRDAVSSFQPELMMMFNTVINQLVTKLPNVLQVDWGRYAHSLRRIPTLKDFDDWIEGVLAAEEQRGKTYQKQTSSTSISKPPSSSSYRGSYGQTGSSSSSRYGSSHPGSSDYAKHGQPSSLSPYQWINLILTALVAKRARSPTRDVQRVQTNDCQRPRQVLRRQQSLLQVPPSWALRKKVPVDVQGLQRTSSRDSSRRRTAISTKS